MIAPVPTLLIVDDEPVVRQTIVSMAERAGFHVAMAASGGAGIRASIARHADLAIVAVEVPGVGGLDVLRAIHKGDPGCRILMTTRHLTIEGAVNAIRMGATDYLGKPLDVARVERWFGVVREQVAARQRLALGELARQRDCYGMIGTGVAMRELFGAIRRLAPCIRTALISGETGTGKELVVRGLHRAGRRADKPFVTVNCSALVETLFESELFGHVRGAFTGATGTKPGLFEVADGGVLFLDEVGELPLAAQAKLLRVLEQGEVHPIGGLRARRVDVQVLAATNRDLRGDLETGLFRRDLFYRLSIAEIHLPALRERPEDIPALADVFLREAAARWQKPVNRFSPVAMTMLCEARWEGNIRELRSVIERASLLADGPLVDEGLLSTCMPPPAVLMPLAPFGPTPAALVLAGTAGQAFAPATAVRTDQRTEQRAVMPLVTITRAHILRTLQHVRGNKKQAAEMLGISRRSLYRRLDRHGLANMISHRA